MLLHKGDQGPEVGRAQQLLIEAGLSLDPVETAASKFDLSTYNAVRQFQASHVGSDGHALYEDGVIGPETLWALMNGQRSLKRQRFTVDGWSYDSSLARPEISGLLAWAVGKIGMQEQPPGSNRGPEIDKWAASAGVSLGSPWCLLFVSAAHHQLSIGSPFGWIASAYKMSEWGKQYRRVLGAGATLLPGDVGVILRADYHGHGYLVARDLGGGKICTVEGNSSDSVRGLIRNRADAACFVRPVPL